MSPIGETLRAAREEKSLTLDRVSDDTNIAKRYLMALEAEDFSVFPGDPYAIGFLRNYAEYLGLSSDDFVATFKNLRIQEQPVPIQDLMPKRGPSTPLIAAIAVGAIAIISLVIILIVGGNKPAKAETDRSSIGPMEYRVEGASFERRLFVGDAILVKVGTESYRVALAKIDDAVTFDTPTGSVRLMLGEEGTLDLDGNGSPEVKILVSDLAKKDPTRGAVIKISYSNPDEVLSAAGQAPQAPALQPEDSIAAAPPTPPDARYPPRSGLRLREKRRPLRGLQKPLSLRPLSHLPRPLPLPLRDGQEG